MNEPYAFCTEGGAVVLKKTLDEYAIKTNHADEDDPFKKRVEATKSTVGEISKQAPEKLYSNYGLYGLVEPPYNLKALSNFTDKNTYHSSSIKTKAIDVAGLGCRLEKVGDKADPEHERILLEFINNCKPSITELINRAAQDEEEIGGGCLEVIRVGGVSGAQPKRLEHVHGHTVRIHKDKNRFMQTWDGITRKWFKYIDEVLHYTGDNEVTPEQDGKEFDVNVKTGEIIPKPNKLSSFETANDLIYDYNYSSKTSYYGTPDWIPVRKSMLGDEAAVDYNLIWFKTYGLPTYAIFITGDFQDEEVKDDRELINGQPNPDYGKKIKGTSVLQQSIEARIKQNIGKPGSGMVIMLPNDNELVKVEVRFEKLSVELKDSAWRLYRLDNSKEVMASHRMDSGQLGIKDTGALGGDTAKQANKNYKNRVVSPRQRRWEDLINKHIIWGDNGFGFKDWKFKLEELDTDDLVQEVTADQQLFNMAGCRPIDLINKWGPKRGFTIPENLKDHPALNAYYINGNPITLEDGNQLLPPEVVKALKDANVAMKEAKKIYESQN